jgi:peptide alpha-N-acetyltransferase
VLETEYDNVAALSLYESLGFIREKRLYRFYLNGKDAFRLVLAVPPPSNGGDKVVDSSAIVKSASSTLSTCYSLTPNFSNDNDDISYR